MKQSRHASKRLQQRAISMDIAEMILTYGDPRPMPGGAVEYTLTKESKALIESECKHILMLADTATKKRILVSKDNGTIITAYHAY